MIASDTQEYENLESYVISVFKRVLSEMPPNVATLEVKHLPKHGTIVELKPNNPHRPARGHTRRKA